ncbi:MAG: DUF2235 domain-containing protein [Nitrosomonas sp.]|nr:DUF2235 domain-containing protein [Nitrosomonas sp.]
MAIYAFDGTGNKDNPDDDKDTNVLKFFNAYKEAYPNQDNFYIRGVGTGNWLSKFFGSIFGMGGHRRVDKAIETLKNNFNKGDERIDIVGFSRGAALALEFANEIHDLEIKGQQSPTINFIGLWDTVASFGIPGNDINLGYTLTIPENTRRCFHAIALDERRKTFPLTHLIQDKFTGRASMDISEVWFRGFHSDIGGGNENEALSSIPLVWMFKRALDAGINIPATHLEIHKNLSNKDAPCNKPRMDKLANRKRTIQKDDIVHGSVSRRQWAAPNFEANNPPKGLKVTSDNGAILPKGFEES